jgi:hypothetical protein
MTCFPITLYVLSLLSTPSSPTALYVVVTFANGLATGSSLNYTLVHLLHLTPASVHPIAISLLATFRGFAASFGSAIGGGLFTRILINSLRHGFAEKGLDGEKEDLIHRLSGSPSLVAKLTGNDRIVAMNSYVFAFRSIFLAAVLLSALMVLIQAGTGRKGLKASSEVPDDDDEDAG